MAASGAKAIISIPRGLGSALPRRTRKKKGSPPISIQPPGTIIISCRNKKYNHYQGQAYNKFSPPSIATQGWKHPKSNGDYFHFNSYRSNPAFLNASKEDAVQTTFEDLGLRSDLIDVLKEQGLTRPTKVQAEAIPHILNFQNLLCAAETGSGKTYAYLLPLFQHLLTSLESGYAPVTTSPQALVLVPARELAHQVMNFAKKLNVSANISLTSLSGVYTTGQLRWKMERGGDLLIATPGAILNALSNGVIRGDAVKYLLIDEVDTLLDDSFSDSTREIINNIPIKADSEPPHPGNSQIILIGATMPKQALETLSHNLPVESMQTVTTGYLHRIMPHVTQKFIKVNRVDKEVKIVEVVKNELKRPMSSVIIFCNRASCCNWLSYLLEQNGVENSRLHGDIHPMARRAVLNDFSTGSTKVLICTDIASRGVDTAMVQHVINFDFPEHMSDYIHRAGRVGRVGSHHSGYVTNFITHKWDVDLVQKIETAVRMHSSLPNVNSNIKQKLVNRSMASDMLGLG